MKTIQRCSTCGLPQTYPGIQLLDSGGCNYCRYFELYKEREKAIKAQLNSEFKHLIETTRKRKHTYDCIVAYSGGKDSTFLLKYLKQKLKFKKILAHTFDNGFTSPTALQNIRVVTKALCVDSKITRPDFSVLKEIFSYSLIHRIPYPAEITAMMSQVCAACIGMVFGTTLRLAIRERIPLLFIGFTPGQYPAVSLENYLKVKSCMYISSKAYRDDPLDIFKIIADPFREQFGKAAEKLFFKSQYIEKNIPVPKILFPFHALLDYDEKYILREIQSLGWVKPQDTDSCSTNCLLNTLGNITAMKNYGYHPYAGELSYLVREGRLGRSDALAAEKCDHHSCTMNAVLLKLNLHNKDLNAHEK